MDAIIDFKIVARDEGLLDSLMKYAIHAKEIEGRVFSEKLTKPIGDMKSFLDGLLHLHDYGRDRVTIEDLFEIVKESKLTKTHMYNKISSSE